MFPASVAGAQRAAAAVGVRPAVPELSAPARAAAVRAAGQAGAARVVRHAAVGALAGAAAGALTAFVVLAASDHPDRSEDGMAYVLFVPAGAALGTIVGAVHGLATGR
jgi:uncharacterized membrane protein